MPERCACEVIADAVGASLVDIRSRYPAYTAVRGVVATSRP